MVRRGKRCNSLLGCFFFFQAEDGIRDADVTGVQTCALPIYCDGSHTSAESSVVMGAAGGGGVAAVAISGGLPVNRVACRISLPPGCSRIKVASKIGRASCRERV